LTVFAFYWMVDLQSTSYPFVSQYFRLTEGQPPYSFWQKLSKTQKIKVLLFSYSSIAYPTIF